MIQLVYVQVPCSKGVLCESLVRHLWESPLFKPAKGQGHPKNGQCLGPPDSADGHVAGHRCPGVQTGLGSPRFLVREEINGP